MNGRVQSPQQHKVYGSHQACRSGGRGSRGLWVVAGDGSSQCYCYNSEDTDGMERGQGAGGLRRVHCLTQGHFS